MNGRPDRAVIRRLVLTAAASPVLLAVALGCASSYRESPSPARRETLDAWIAATPDSLGNVAPVVMISLPHSALVFRRVDGLYVAEVDLTVVARRDDRQVGGGVGSGRAEVDSDAATRGRTPLEIQAPVLVRGAEPATLEVVARARGSTRRWERRLAFAPRSYAAAPLWIGDVSTSLVPAASGGLRVAAEADSVLLHVRLVRPRQGAGWPAGGVELVSEVTGHDPGPPRRRARALAETDAAPQAPPIALTWPVARLPFGRSSMQLAVEAQIDGQRWRLPREPALSFINLTVPLDDDRAWRRHLVWLDGYLPAGRRDSLRALPAAFRPEAWAALWDDLAAGQGSTATVAREAHLLRIVAADERFGGFGRGALSDRGRMLIRWGEPERIERVADERVPGAVYEVWSVPQAGLRFVFYDAHGLGDFRLQQTLPLDF